MVERYVDIPNEVKIEVRGNEIKVSGPKGTIEKKLPVPAGVKIEVSDGKVKVYSESEKRKVKAIVGSLAAHIRNAITGVTKGWEYKLRIVYSHFPVTVKVENGKVVIQNFLGERKPREAKIVGNSKVEIKGKDIIVTGIDIEEVGQTAANIEQATRVVGRDRRVFQDGIYIIEKKGKSLLGE